jgi:5-(carboxyamino)imidazole ribonucleotide synthase
VYNMDLYLGILGGGQLARMMALAAHSIGIRTKCVDPDPDAPASQVTDCGVFSFDDSEGISKFFEGVSAVTYEFENVSCDTVRALEKKFTVCPSVKALEVTQNRVREKNFCKKLGVPVPNFISAVSPEALLNHEKQLPFPGILKRTSGGYDGKGQWKVSGLEELKRIADSVEPSEVILEELIDFDRECSCIAVRSVSGEMKFYAICENTHVGGVLFRTLAPPVVCPSSLEQKLQNYTRLIADSLSYVGVIAVEFFIKGEDVYFNEFAPRVHNTGHWTIEGADISQFQNHVRACLQLPLGSTESRGKSLMYNLLGTRGEVTQLLSLPGVQYHWYGKKEVRDRRKVGHVTSVCAADDERAERQEQLLKLVQ